MSVKLLWHDKLAWFIYKIYKSNFGLFQALTRDLLPSPVLFFLELHVEELYFPKVVVHGNERMRSHTPTTNHEKRTSVTENNFLTEKYLCWT